MNENRISIHIASRDRHSELSLCLQGLRTQSYKNFDIVVLDDASGNPVVNCQFLMALISRMKLEGHRIKLIRNNVSQGVCHARNTLIEADPWKENPLILRIDDDVIPQPDYIMLLLSGITEGKYDLVSGVTPLMAQPDLRRKTDFVKPVINPITISGDDIHIGDDCGCAYLTNDLITTPHFRSCALYKRKIHEAEIMYEKNLTTVGFREEALLSLRALLKGFKLGVMTQATVYHFQTQSGGVRDPEYPQKVMIDEQTFKEFLKNNEKELKKKFKGLKK